MQNNVLAKSSGLVGNTTILPALFRHLQAFLSFKGFCDVLYRMVSSNNRKFIGYLLASLRRSTLNMTACAKELDVAAPQTANRWGWSPGSLRRSAINPISQAASGRIDVRGVDVIYGQDEVAVSGVSLHIESGEFVSVVGPSGCGKSTLLNIIAGFIPANRGEVLLDNRPIKGPGPERGVVFQHHSLFPWLTVRGNVEVGLQARGLGRVARRQIADELLKRSGLLCYAGHYPEALSGGMRQRVGIMRALANEPRVLLLDEPFGALDTQTRSIMQEVLLDIWQRFRTSVLFITHDINEAVFLSDRVYVMGTQPGCIKAELTVPLPRPRCHEMTADGVGRELVQRATALIREESLQAIHNGLLAES